MLDDSNAIETIVPAEQWEKLMQLYTRLLGQPQHLSDSEALFASPDDGLTIRLTKEGTTRELTNVRPPSLRLRGGPNGLMQVQKEYAKLLNDHAGNIADMMPPFVRGPQGNECTIALVWTGNTYSGKPDSQLECMVHNPNW